MINLKKSMKTIRSNENGQQQFVGTFAISHSEGLTINNVFPEIF
jgi:hypothetical protein